MDLDFFEEIANAFRSQRRRFCHCLCKHRTLSGEPLSRHFWVLPEKVRQLQSGKSDAEANKLSVCLELQADFYAGLWAHYNQKYIEEGDIEEALSAA